MICKDVFLFLFIVLLSVTMFVLMIVPVHGTKIYNCSMAEFHPDYPPDVVKQCREKNAKKINETGTTGQDRNRQ
jgi:hypothetical protein